MSALLLLLVLTVWLSAAFIGVLGEGMFGLTLVALPLLLTAGAWADLYSAYRHGHPTAAGSPRHRRGAAYRGRFRAPTVSGWRIQNRRRT